MFVHQRMRKQLPHHQHRQLPWRLVAIYCVFVVVVVVFYYAIAVVDCISVVVADVIAVVAVVEGD